MDDLERAIGDLVIANRILAKEDVVDAYGHVSIRHPQQARPLSAVALAQPGVRHPRRHHRVQARRHAGRATRARPISSASSTARSTRRGRTSTPWSIRTPRTSCRSASPRRRCAASRTWRATWARMCRCGISPTNSATRPICWSSTWRRAATWPASWAATRVVLMRGHGFSAAADGAAQAGAAVRCTCRATPASCWPRCGWASSRRMSEGEINTRNKVPRRLAGNAARLGVLGAPRRLRRHARPAARAGSERMPSRRIDVHFHLIPQFYADSGLCRGLGPGDRPLSGLVAGTGARDHGPVRHRHRADFARPARRAVLQAGRGQGAGAPLQRLFRRAQRASTASASARSARCRCGTCADAVEEIGYCLDTLKFSGVSLFASYDGMFLGDAEVRSGDGGAQRARRRGVRASRHASAQQADRPAVAVLHDGVPVRHHAGGGEPDVRRRAGALSAHPLHPAARRRAGAVFLLAAVGVADDRQAAASSCRRTRFSRCCGASGTTTRCRPARRPGAAWRTSRRRTRSCSAPTGRSPTPTSPPRR